MSLRAPKAPAVRSITAPCIHHTATLGKNVELGPGVIVKEFAVIADGAAIGAGTVIHAHVYVGAKTTIGVDCTLLEHSTVREDCILGDRVRLGVGATVGSDGFGFATSQGAHHKIPQVGRVIVEDDVEIGANATVDRATMGATRLRRGSRIENLVQLGHNVELGEGAIVEFQTGVAGSTKIGSGTHVGKRVGIAGHLKIGDSAKIADCSGIMRAPKSGESVAGAPALPVEMQEEIDSAMEAAPQMLRAVKQLEARVKELEAMRSAVRERVSV